MLANFRIYRKLIASFLLPFYLLQSCAYSGYSNNAKHYNQENQEKRSINLNDTGSLGEICRNFVSADIESDIEYLSCGEVIDSKIKKTKYIVKQDKRVLKDEIPSKIYNSKNKAICIPNKLECNISSKINLQASKNLNQSSSIKKNSEVALKNSNTNKIKYLPASVLPDPDMEIQNSLTVSKLGYIIKLFNDNNFWKAMVLDEPVKGLIRKQIVPVLCEFFANQAICSDQDMGLELSKYIDFKNNLLKKDKIHLNSSNTNSEIFVYLGEKMGLKGGMDLVNSLAKESPVLMKLVTVATCTSAGAYIGAQIGSIFGPKGTIIGGVIGGIVGFVAGLLSAIFCGDTKEQKMREVQGEINICIRRASDEFEKQREHAINFGKKIGELLSLNSPTLGAPSLPRVLNDMNTSLIPGFENVMKQMQEFRSKIYSDFYSCAKRLDNEIINPLQELIDHLKILAKNEFPKKGEAQVIHFFDQYINFLKDDHLESIFKDLEKDQRFGYNDEVYSKKVLLDLAKFEKSMQTQLLRIEASTKFYIEMQCFFNNGTWKSWASENFGEKFSKKLKELDDAMKKYNQIIPITESAAFKHFEDKDKSTKKSLEDSSDTTEVYIKIFADFSESIPNNQKKGYEVINELDAKFEEGTFFKKLNSHIEDYIKNIKDYKKLFKKWKKNRDIWEKNIGKLKFYKIDIDGLLEKILEKQKSIRKEEIYFIGNKEKDSDDEKDLKYLPQQTAVERLKKALEFGVKDAIENILDDFKKSEQQNISVVNEIFEKYNSATKKIDGLRFDFRRANEKKYAYLSRDKSEYVKDELIIDVYKRAYFDEKHGEHYRVKGTPELMKCVEEYIEDEKKLQSSIIEFRKNNCNYKDIRKQIEKFENYGENLRQHCGKTLEYLESVVEWQAHIDQFVKNKYLSLTLIASFYELIAYIYKNIQEIVKLEGPNLENIANDNIARENVDKRELLIYGYLCNYASRFLDNADSLTKSQTISQQVITSKQPMTIQKIDKNQISGFVKDSKDILNLYCDETSKNCKKNFYIKDPIDKKIGKSTFGGGYLAQLKQKAESEIITKATAYERFLEKTISNSLKGANIESPMPSISEVFKNFEDEKSNQKKRYQRRENVNKALEKLLNSAKSCGIDLKKLLIKLDEESYDPPFNDSGVFLISTQNILDGSEIISKGQISEFLSISDDVNKYRDILGSDYLAERFKLGKIRSDIESKLKEAAQNYNSLVIDYKISENPLGSMQLSGLCEMMLNPKFTEGDLIVVMKKLSLLGAQPAAHQELEEKTVLLHTVEKNYPIVFDLLLSSVCNDSAFKYDNGTLDSLVQNKGVSEKIKMRWSVYKKLHNKI